MIFIKTLDEKYEILKDYIRSMKSVAVAYSSGVDSTLLLKVAREVLGENAIAVTASSLAFPKHERDEAGQYCSENGIKQIIVHIDEMKVEGFRENPPNRCYLCKKSIFTALWAAARENGMSALAEGSNMDDLSDYRPGLLAVKELGVISPLRYAGLSKAEIRELSRRLGLPTWSKPSYACLASRFVYGEEITSQKLEMVDRAEQYLMELGFSQLRVRIHGMMARIEILPKEFNKFFKGGVYEKVCDELKNIGFTYVTLDLQGYRTGSMNEVIDTAISYD